MTLYARCPCFFCCVGRSLSPAARPPVEPAGRHSEPLVAIRDDTPAGEPEPAAVAPENETHEASSDESDPASEPTDGGTA